MALAVEVNATPPASGSLSEADVPKETTGKLAELFAEAETPEDVIEPAEEKEEKGKPGEEVKSPETDESKTEVTETPAETDEADKPTPESTPKGPVLPASFRRTLKAYGYEDSEIDDSVAAGGEKFIQAASKMHQARSKEIAAWADLGRKSKATTTSSTPQAQPAADSGVLKPIDMEALQRTYGKDEALIQQLTPVNQAIAELNRILPTVRQYEQTAQASAKDTLANQVNSFFADGGLKDFHEHYGTEIGKLTDEQYVNRTKVLETADAIFHGASQQGRNVPISEALQMAHDSTTGEVKTKTARQEIAKTLQTRQNGMTLKPASRKPLNAGSENKDMRANVKSGLKKVFS